MASDTSQIALVVAVAHNGVIGSNGELPWRLRDDMALFKQITMGHPIIMGRKTYDSIGKPLPGRTNIVVSRVLAAREGLESVGSIENALDLAKEAPGSDLICIIGGGEIYRQTLPLADIVYLSKVDANVEGDTHFPALPSWQWRVVEEKAFEAGERNQYGFVFQKLVRYAGLS